MTSIGQILRGGPHALLRRMRRSNSIDRPSTHSRIDWLDVLSKAFIGVCVIGVIVLVVGVIVYTATAPKSGVIQASWLEPAHFEMYQSGSVCHSYDKNNNCTSSTPIYSQRWVPDVCKVKIYNGEAERFATWPVNCGELASYQVGKFVSFN